MKRGQTAFYPSLPEAPSACLTLDREDLHQKKVARVIELQGEIEGKNQDISDVWKEVHKRDDTITEMHGIIQKNEQTITRLRAELVACQTSLEVVMQAREQAEQSLRHIQTTKAWRFIQKLYGVKNKLW